MFSVSKEFSFAAAHFLTKYKGKCENLHGHNYKLIVTVAGPLNEDDLVLDFHDIKTIVQKQVLDQLDHTSLNDRFSNPSCELVAKWIFDQIKSQSPMNTMPLTVQLWETPTSFVTYNGE